MFYFKEGFSWNLINGTRSENDLKFRYSSPCVNDVGAMTLHNISNLISDKYIIALCNSKLINSYSESYINFTINFQVNDCRIIPIVIPNEDQLKHIEKLFNEAFSLRKKIDANKESDKDYSQELNNIMLELNKLVNSLYFI